jgi:predicted RNA binding protein YcfA (HicA-like mRNA interferase family)
MPPKIRELKAALAKAGFVERSAKGSHTFWVHPDFTEFPVMLSGKNGDDAEKYQIKDVRNALKKQGEENEA